MKETIPKVTDTETLQLRDPLQHCVIRLGRVPQKYGSLVKPYADKRRNMFGRVLQIGSKFHPEDYKLRPVEVNDLVIFKDWGSLIAIPQVGKNLYLVPFKEIVAWIIQGGCDEKE